MAAKLERTKLKGAYWFRTACKDGTESGYAKEIYSDNREFISFLPCTKAQMSADPSLIDDPTYFEA